MKLGTKTTSPKLKHEPTLTKGKPGFPTLKVMSVICLLKQNSTVSEEDPEALQ